MTNEYLKRSESDYSNGFGCVAEDVYVKIITDLDRSLKQGYDSNIGGNTAGAFEAFAGVYHDKICPYVRFSDKARLEIMRVVREHEILGKHIDDACVARWIDSNAWHFSTGPRPCNRLLVDIPVSKHSLGILGNLCDELKIRVTLHRSGYFYAELYADDTCLDLGSSMYYKIGEWIMGDACVARRKD